MSRVCRACGLTNGDGVWLCGCGQDLREPNSALEPGERFRQTRRPRAVLRLVGPIFALSCWGGGAGVLAGYSGPSGFLGRDFDVMIDGIVGAAGGAALGVVVGIVLFVTRPRSRP